jgi:hypothetical protein
MASEQFKLHPELQDILEDLIETMIDSDSCAQIGGHLMSVDPQQLFAKVLSKMLDPKGLDDQMMLELWQECVEDNVPDQFLPDCEF